MGKSAKLHKRTSKKLKSSAVPSASSAINVTTQSHVNVARKKSTLKEKSKGKSEAGKDGLLGGADYVTLMMGGRKKAKEEADKLHGVNAS